MPASRPRMWSGMVWCRDRRASRSASPAPTPRSPPGSGRAAPPWDQRLPARPPQSAVGGGQRTHEVEQPDRRLGDHRVAHQDRDQGDLADPGVEQHLATVHPKRIRKARDSRSEVRSTLAPAIRCHHRSGTSGSASEVTASKPRRTPLGPGRTSRRLSQRAARRTPVGTFQRASRLSLWITVVSRPTVRGAMSIRGMAAPGWSRVGLPSTVPGLNLIMTTCRGCGGSTTPSCSSRRRSRSS